MSDLRQTTRRLFEAVISNGDFALVPELIAPDYTDPSGPAGPEGFAAGLQAVRAAFPDWSSTLEDLIVEGDTVAARWTVRGTQEGPFMGLPATGRAVEMQECGFLRFSGGKLVRIDRVADELSLMRQLGALPTPPAAS